VRSSDDIITFEGLCNWFLDSFSNMQFYPISFKHGRPTTMWRQSVEAHAELQKHGIRFMMESLGQSEIRETPSYRESARGHG
jgi:hypothetical protein